MTPMSFKPWRWRLVLAGLLGLVVLTFALWLADLMGVSKSWINGFFLVVSIIGYAVIGMLCRTTNAEEYYVAGRRVSAPFNGMATAADWMSAASFWVSRACCCRMALWAMAGMQVVWPMCWAGPVVFVCWVSCLPPSSTLRAL